MEMMHYVMVEISYVRLDSSVQFIGSSYLPQE